MSAERVVIAHLSDLHFGGYADLAQIEALEAFLPTLGAGRHRHLRRPDPARPARRVPGGARLLQPVARRTTPVLVVPGNHDIEWWKSPLGLLGEQRKYSKYSRYFPDLRPVLEIPGAVIAGALSSYGVALGLADLEHPRRRGEGAPAGPRDRPGHDDLRQGAARSRAGARVPSQRAAGRALAADGARQLALGVPPAARHRRRRHPLRTRPPGGRGTDRRKSGREHLGHPQSSLPRRAPVGVQPGDDRRRRGTHSALPLGASDQGVHSAPTRSPSRERVRRRSPCRWREEIRACDPRGSASPPLPARPARTSPVSSRTPIEP